MQVRRIAVIRSNFECKNLKIFREVSSNVDRCIIHIYICSRLNRRVCETCGGENTFVPKCINDRFTVLCRQRRRIKCYVRKINRHIFVDRLRFYFSLAFEFLSNQYVIRNSSSYYSKQTPTIIPKYDKHLTRVTFFFLRFYFFREFVYLDVGKY